MFARFLPAKKSYSNSTKNLLTNLEKAVKLHSNYKSIIPFGVTNKIQIKKLKNAKELQKKQVLVLLKNILGKITSIQLKFKKNIGKNHITQNANGKNVYPKISEMNVIVQKVQTEQEETKKVNNLMKKANSVTKQVVNKATANKEIENTLKTIKTQIGNNKKTAYHPTNFGA